MHRIGYNEPSLITNSEDSSFYHELNLSINTCDRFFFSVAFINYSGLQLILDSLKAAEKRNVTGKIIASTYLNFTDIKSLKKLQDYSNIETKIYITDQTRGFHTKGYIFEYEEYFKIIVGSSNITQSALKSNVEWNIRYLSKTKTDTFTNQIIDEFNLLWDHTSQINEAFLKQYEDFLSEIEKFTKMEKEIFEHRFEIQANSMQQKALMNLEALRVNHQKSALIIAATGTGKTYLSAFDVKQAKAKRILFLVHREVILNEAMHSFKHILPDRLMTKLQGSKKEMNAEITFAMIPTMYNKAFYTQFDPKHFDYIIADEAHRAYSTSFRTLLDYFEPEFLLGMTATPERTDHGNIFELFNYNIALEIRLRDALKEDLVIPFHYFGIKDVSADLSDIDISKIDEVARRLSIKDRVDFVLEKVLHYGHSGSKRKCLAFCASKEHAIYMEKEFNSMDFPSIALTGESSDQERMNAIKNLENQNHPLEFIFTIDIFNEGVDIPTVNLVLMLRPTQSPIIFTQQLGRGLRKHPEKDFLTIIDFIGNHNKTFLIPIALSGSRYYEKDSLKVQVYNDFSDIPGCTNIYLEQIAKDDILKQLDRVNLNNMEYLKKEYQEFQKILGGKTPKLTDYALYDASPDPTKFILKENSYIEFVQKIENQTLNTPIDTLLVQRSLDKMLPIKRINEFVIMKHLIQHGTLDYATAKVEIQKILIDLDEKSLEHSFKYLSGHILGTNEKDPFPYVEGNGTDFLRLTDFSLLGNTELLDTVDYGILRFQEEFDKVQMPYPYLKLYQPYKMKDMGFLTNYEKSFSSIRGSGVWRHNDHYYLFVDLHKDANIDERINYKDKLISRTHMQWETQNKTSQNSDTGKDLCLNEQRNIKLHMFVRKAKQIGTQKIDYIYIGKVSTIDFQGNKPITLQLELNTPLPKHIFEDLTLVI